MQLNRKIRLVSMLAAPLLVSTAVLAQAGAASASSSTLYVSPNGTSSGQDTSCQTAAYKTIQSAVNAATSGDTVVACRGVYHEQVLLVKPLSLTGEHATIDETGVKPPLVVTIPGLGKQRIYAAVVIGSSDVSVSGFTIQHAQGEGILAAGLGGPISHLSIRRNAVVHNDLGGTVAHPAYFECKANGAVPGDCGEGIHFIAVAFSTIGENLVKDNSGGILFTDEFGPTHNNLVTGNVVTGNASDCGITMPGHNPAALNSAGQPQPSVAGVYNNVITGNVVTRNGLKGFGAGVLFANAAAGTASYNNLVTDNYIAYNGLSGVTMHAHTIAPGAFEDLSNNDVIGNYFGTNNLLGDPLDSPASPKDLKKTGILVFSGGTPVTLRIAGNHISDNVYGIWLSKKVVTARGLLENDFNQVKIPISRH
jgi:hypothetical protein